MSEGTPVFHLIAVLIIGIILFIKGFKWQKQKRLIEDTPTSKIRGLAMGDVEVYGEAKNINDKEFIISPFSETPCFYCKYTIEEYRRSGKNSRWVTIQQGEERVLFYLKDDTDKVLVNIKEAEIDIPVDFEKYTRSLTIKEKNNAQKLLNFQSSDIKLKQTFEDNNIKVEKKGFESAKKLLEFVGTKSINNDMRFREYYIAPNDKLYIFGKAQVNKLVDEGTAKTNSEGIMIGKSENMFYVSDKSEKEVLSKFKWKVIGGIYGGATLILVSLLILFSYFDIL